jgi:Lhr-like helicase
MLPKRDELLIETFPRGSRCYMVAYPFEGRLAHQTLGMLLTRRLERAGAKPLGFVATDYSLGIWGLEDMGHDDPHRTASASPTCSTRTCWATISKPGSTNPSC